ncbi:MAG: EAL domain-containing protein, partial [Thermoanaerobaculia bacterium]|nr:EAL domain-containing protein [Thermoanaerobaculia bacterium]
MRILLVEDESSHAELIRRAFDRRGDVDLTVVDTIEKARSMLAEERPDVIIADHLLPDGNGIELIERDSVDPSNPPVVIMTSHGDEQLAVEAMKSGALDYVAKSDAAFSTIPRIIDRAMREWKLLRERKRTEEALYESEKRFRALYDETPSMFFTIDGGRRILSVNQFGAEYLGHSVESLLRTSYVELFAPEQRDYVRRNLDAAFGDESVRRFEAAMVTRAGVSVWVRVTTRTIDQGADQALLIVCEDVSEAHTLSEELSYQATHDSLTRLLNWSEFERRLASVLRRAKNEEIESALCYLDLDRFRDINDSCGHRAGDELLREIAVLLQQQVRGADTLARLGGDEFAVLMEGCTLNDARKVAAKLHETVEQLRFVWEGQVLSIAVSIGVVQIHGRSGSVEEVMSAADAACFVAKKEGRNRYQIYREDDAVIARHHGEIRWVGRLQRALEENRFELYFQPIHAVGSSDDGIRHAEILLRMRDENGEIITPGNFLPAAERYHLIARIDQWVVREALTWLGERPHLIERTGLWSVNLSGQSMGAPGMLRFIIDQLEHCSVPPESLCFEVTETSAIANFSRAEEFIRELRQRGCRFALDDFGTGVSSLAYLKLLPVDMIKIDGMFIRDVARDDVDAVAVRSI